MIKDNNNEFEIRIAPSSISSLFNDDIERQILSPLSCLREYGTHWLLEFDLPLVKISRLHLMKILSVWKLN